MVAWKLTATVIYNNNENAKTYLECKLHQLYFEFITSRHPKKLVSFSTWALLVESRRACASTDFASSEKSDVKSTLSQ